MLDYKWGYADGRISQWTRPDLEDLLLGHFPRKVAIDKEDILRVVHEIADFLQFLQRTSRLTGDSLHDLLDELDGLRPDLVSAMQDPANFGMAKSVSAQMQAEGVDILQPGAIERWIEDFNRRPFETRVWSLPRPRLDITLRRRPHSTSSRGSGFGQRSAPFASGSPGPSKCISSEMRKSEPRATSGEAQP